MGAASRELLGSANALKLACETPITGCVSFNRPIRPSVVAKAETRDRMCVTLVSVFTDLVVAMLNCYYRYSLVKSCAQHEMYDQQPFRVRNLDGSTTIK